MRAMPSPIWSTVPTSERSVSTSYCSILDFRIRVISSGRSFKVSPSLSSRRQFSTKSFDPAAHAGVHAHRAGLEDESSDQAWVDRTARVDRAAGRLLDLADDPLRFLVGELVRGGQVDGQTPFLRGDQALEL